MLTLPLKPNGPTRHNAGATLPERALHMREYRQRSGNDRNRDRQHQVTVTDSARSQQKIKIESSQKMLFK